MEVKIIRVKIVQKKILISSVDGFAILYLGLM